MYGDRMDFTSCPYCGSTVGHKPGCPRDDSEPEITGVCEICGAAIYQGDEIIRYDGQCWHRDCFCDEYGAEA